MQADSSLLTETLPEKLAAALAERVIAGQHEPGERLVESALVRSFNVSHGPVRDALRILHNSGLVTIHPYRGAQVTELSVREVKEIYQVRAALVGLRARWLAEDPLRGELVAQVEEPIARLSELARTPKTRDEYVRVALSINRTLTDSLTNRWLRSMLQALTLQTSRYTRLALAGAERRRESARLWRRLLQTIKSGDGERAQSIASRISLATRDAAIKYLEETHGGRAR